MAAVSLLAGPDEVLAQRLRLLGLRQMSAVRTHTNRTVMVSFRKLFLPSPATFRRMREQERQREQGSATP